MDRKKKLFVAYGCIIIIFILFAVMLIPFGVKKDYSDISNTQLNSALCATFMCKTDADCVNEYCGAGMCVGDFCSQGEEYLRPEPTVSPPTTYYCFDTYLTILALVSLPFVIAGLLISMKFFPKHRRKFVIALVSYTIFILVLFFLFVTSAESKKPVIYLYPETTTAVSVEVVPDVSFTHTIPQIVDNRWDVIAHPSGELEFEGEIYPYLFYEVLTRKRFDLSKGWVVDEYDIVPWFNEYLPRMGLNGQETKDFVDYWGVNLPESEYYKITLLDPDEYDKAAHLTINPQPDTMIRVVLVLEVLNEPVSIEAPVLSPPKREGFVAVEWGVILM